MLRMIQDYLVWGPVTLDLCVARTGHVTGPVIVAGTSDRVDTHRPGLSIWLYD